MDRNGIITVFLVCASIVAMCFRLVSCEETRIEANRSLRIHTRGLPDVGPEKQYPEPAEQKAGQP